MSGLSDDNQSTGVPLGERGVHDEDLQVHSYDVDFSKNATPQAICRWFLEAAWNHAEQLGFGFAMLSRENRLWVLARLLLEFTAYPTWGDPVRLSTWPRGVSGAFALRDFELCNNTGSKLVAATSSWLVLDASSHRPLRIDKLLFSIPCHVTRQAVGRDSKKILDLKIDTVSLTTGVRYSDIDVNFHVNSVSYLGWLLNSYPAEFHRDHVVRSVEINYVGETKWSDDVSVLSHERSPLTFDHAIINSQRLQVCRAELIWGDRNNSPPQVP